jgi:hypothetical protein
MAMEYRIELVGRVEHARLQALLAQEDPSAVSDVDPGRGLLRVSTALPARDLAQVLARAGAPTPVALISQLPSVCCGGCSG